MIFNSLSNNSGFTLLGIVMGLLGVSVVATSILLSVPSQNSNEKILVTVKRMKELKTAIYKYKFNNVSIPPALDNLVTQGIEPDCAVNLNTASTMYKTLRGWCGPYYNITFAEDMESFKLDGWGTPFLFTEASIQSCGPNSICGDGDDIFEEL